jgi:hypothetical protein
MNSEILKMKIWLTFANSLYNPNLKISAFQIYLNWISSFRKVQNTS